MLKKNNKATKLMKNKYPLIYLFFDLGIIYHEINKYNKSKFYLKKRNIIH